MRIDKVFIINKFIYLVCFTLIKTLARNEGVRQAQAALLQNASQFLYVMRLCRSSSKASPRHPTRIGAHHSMQWYYEYRNGSYKWQPPERFTLVIYGVRFWGWILNPPGKCMKQGEERERSQTPLWPYCFVNRKLSTLSTIASLWSGIFTLFFLSSCRPFDRSPRRGRGIQLCCWWRRRSGPWGTCSRTPEGRAGMSAWCRTAPAHNALWVSVLLLWHVI